jgi:hypothetical protein
MTRLGELFPHQLLVSPLASQGRSQKTGVWVRTHHSTYVCVCVCVYVCAAVHDCEGTEPEWGRVDLGQRGCEEVCQSSR